jgi:hypothetical protein
MWYKWAKRLLAGIGIFIALLFGITALIIYLYEDEIKQYAVEELNKNLAVPVAVEEIELTLFSQFPSASLRFNKLFISDTANSDTLMYAEHLYMNFNFWEMVGGGYTVNEVKAENSVIKLHIDSLGNENYRILKEDSLDKKKDKFSFALQEVSFDKIRLSYSNHSTQQYYSINSESINFTGNFSQSNYELSATSNFYINQLKSNSIKYVENKNAAANIVLKIHTDSSLYQLKKAEFSIEDLLFDINGKYTNNKDSSFMNLNIKGRNIDLQTAFSIFPKEYFEALSEYKASGMVVFETTIEGVISKDSSPRIVSDFTLQDGSLTEKKTGAHLNKLSLEGHFESRNKKNQEEITFKNINGVLENGKIKGNVLVSNFKNPSVKADLSGNLSMAKIKQFINSKKIETLDGNALFQVEFAGIFNTANGAKPKIKTSNGFIKIENVSLKTKTSHLAFTDLNGNLSLKKNDAAFSDLTGSVLSSQFKADGIIKNIIPFLLFEEEQLVIETDFRSKSVSLNEIMGGPTTSLSEESIPLTFPDNINFNLKSHIGELTYGKFTATNLKGIVTYQNKKLAAKNIIFNANKGSYIVSSEMHQTDIDSFFWTIEGTANNIDIQNFFMEFNDFGQKFLTHKNIKGKTTVQVSLATVIDGNMNIDMDRLYSVAKFSIKKGELIDQPALLDIADYFESNKIVKTVIDTELLKKKMKHVKFANLDNKIIIDKGKIHIPQMALSTNVMDLNVSGIHGFDDNVDYHLNFRLNDVLVKNKDQDEFGPIKDDGLGVKLFLHMYGNLSDLKYELDKKEKKTARKEAIKEEKQDLKSILKQEFGLFKKDSTIQTPDEEKTKTTFEVEWDEFDNEPDVTTEKETDKTEEKKKKDKNKGLNKFLKKLGIEEEEKKKVEIEIEG